MQAKLTGVKEIDELLYVIHDGAAPKWKHDAAIRRFTKIKRRHDLIVTAIKNSEEYPYDTIRGIVKGDIV